MIQLREAVEDRRAWRALVHGVTKSRAQLNNWTTTKAFNGVKWPTLKLLIKVWGFGKIFIGVIDQLYSDNTSEVIVNDGLAEWIFLGWGTRQGCPLSPILFCMVIELLANEIRNDELIKGLGKMIQLRLICLLTIHCWLLKTN